MTSRYVSLRFCVLELRFCTILRPSLRSLRFCVLELRFYTILCTRITFLYDSVDTSLRNSYWPLWNRFHYIIISIVLSPRFFTIQPLRYVSLSFWVLLYCVQLESCFSQFCEPKYVSRFYVLAAFVRGKKILQTRWTGKNVVQTKNPPFPPPSPLSSLFEWSLGVTIGPLLSQNFRLFLIRVNVTNF